MTLEERIEEWRFGESWPELRDLDEDEARALGDLINDLIAAYREAQRDKERLDCIVRRLLDGWPEYPGIDGFDTQDLLEETGFLVRSTVTAEDCADGWPADCNLSEGDDCLRVSARGRAAIDAARQKGEG